MASDYHSVKYIFFVCHEPSLQFLIFPRIQEDLRHIMHLHLHILIYLQMQMLVVPIGICVAQCLRISYHFLTTCIHIYINIARLTKKIKMRLYIKCCHPLPFQDAIAKPCCQKFCLQLHTTLVHIFVSLLDFSRHANPPHL